MILHLHLFVAAVTQIPNLLIGEEIYYHLLNKLSFIIASHMLHAKSDNSF